MRKTIYISVPMAERKEEQIEADVQNAMQRLSEIWAAKLELYFIDPREVAKRWDKLADNTISITVPKIYNAYLGFDIAFLLENADAVAFCRGWENSKGCRLEFAAAEIYGKEIIYL
jgi:hypothetical protein